MKTELDNKVANSGTHAAPPPSRFTPKPKGSWQKLIGRAKNDDLAHEAYRLGAEWRAKMNLEGR